MKTNFEVHQSVVGFNIAIYFSEEVWRLSNTDQEKIAHLSVPNNNNNILF